MYLKNKYEVPNFCMIFTIFMVLSQFQILLSLTQCSPVPLLYLNEDVGFKVQIKNKHEVPDFCMYNIHNFHGHVSISNLIEVVKGKNCG